MKRTIVNEAEMIELGKKIAVALKAGDVMTLHGRLGAGKTTLVKGIAKGLGVSETVTSPTFTILSQYEGDLTMTHMDLYRLGSEEEFELLGAEDFFYAGGITLIEWSEKARSFLPKHTLKISISVNPETQERTVEAEGEQFDHIVF